MKTEQLKALLRQKGTKVTGKKRDLVDRLDAYDRNDDFGRLEATDETEKQFSVPSEVTFASLSAKHKPGMPNFD